MILRGRGWLGQTISNSTGLTNAPSSPATAVLETSRVSRLRPMTRCVRVALEIAATRGSVARGDVVTETGHSGELARRALIELVRLGHLRRTGHRRGTRYVVT